MGVISVFKKFLRGEEILLLKREQSIWDAQFKRGNWKEAEELGQNLGIVSRMVVEASFEKPIKVLDVGCGSGVQGQYLSVVDGVTYHGIDISAEAINQAQTRVPKGTFWVGKMEEGLSSNTKFDVIIFAEVLLYVDYEKTFAQFKQYLSSDGFLVLSLYDTWRTRIIWRKLSAFVTIKQDVRVYDNLRGIGWRVCKCQFK